MATVTVKNGNYESYLYIDYSFSSNSSNRTWGLSTSLKLHLKSGWTFGPWSHIGNNSANLQANGLAALTGGENTLATYSTSGNYDNAGTAPTVRVTWAFNVNSSWGGFANSPSGYVDLTGPSIGAATGSFNLNILNPDGSEPYSTGEAGSVEQSINGGSYSRVYNESASSYGIGTTFNYRNFSPGAGRYLASVSGLSPNNTTGPWSATQGSSTTISFNTAWNTYYRDINAWKPGNSEQNGLIFDYYIYNRSGTLVDAYYNVTNEQANTVTREYGYTGKINNIRTNVTGAHYTTNNVTGTGASEFTWTYNNTNAIELYSAWDTHTMTLWPGSGTYNGSSSNYQLTQEYPTSATIGFPTAPTGHMFAGYSCSGPLSGISSRDAIFESGNGGVGVYNNSSNGTVTITREQNNDVPNRSMGSSSVGYQLKIAKAAGTASPYCGGFVLSQTAQHGHVYRHIIWAKIPVGYTIGHYRNAIGDGGWSEWLTDTRGTGDWYRYVYDTHCGSTGSLSNFGHVAIHANNGDNNAAVTWYVCATQITDITGNLSYPFTSDSSIECFYAPVVYKVSYNANGGDSAPGEQLKTYNMTLALTTTQPTRSSTTSSCTVSFNANEGASTVTSRTANRTTNYSFANWNTASGGTGTTYAPGASYTGNAATTLYAQWTSTTTAYGAITLPTIAECTRKDYKLLGFATDKTATTITLTPGASYTPTGNVTLYAIWEEDQAKARIKTSDGTWVTGKVFVKVEDEWKKAKKVYVKIDDQWKIGKNSL